MRDPTSRWLERYVHDRDIASAIESLLADETVTDSLRGLSDQSRLVRPFFEAIGIDHGGEAYGLAWAVCLHAGPDSAIPEIVGFLLQPRAYEDSLAKLYRECGYSADSIAPRQASLAFALALDVLVNLLPRSSDPDRWRSALTRLADSYEEKGGAEWLGDSARQLRAATR